MMHNSEFDVNRCYLLFLLHIFPVARVELMLIFYENFSNILGTQYSLELHFFTVYTNLFPTVLISSYVFY